MEDNIADFAPVMPSFEDVADAEAAKVQAGTTAKVEAKKVDADAEAEEPEVAEEGGDEEDEEVESDEEEDSEDEDESQEEGEAKASKKLKAILEDGSKVDLTSNAMIKIKVNGKYEKVALSDLASDYNGRKSHAETLRIAAEEKKAVLQEKQKISEETEQLTETLKDINTAITEGNIMQALATVAKLEGKDPKAVMDSWLEGMNSFMEEYAKSTPAERDAKAKKFKLENELKEMERKKQKIISSEERREVNEFIENACKTHDLTRDELGSAKKALEGAGIKDFTLNKVVETAVEYKLYTNIVDYANELGISLQNEDSNYLLDVVKAYQRKNGTRLSKQEYVSLLKAYADKEEASLSRKVDSKAKTTPKSKKQEPKSITRVSELWD